MDELTTTNLSESSVAVARERMPWKWLLLIVLVGLTLRIASFSAAFSNPNFRWVDADQYMAVGYDVATVHRPFGDRIVRAAAYDFLGYRFYLPPLYTLTLAVFALFPHYPLNAAIGQAVLGAFSAVFVFVIGQRLHSRRTGLIAAGLFAVWPPFTTGVEVFLQEQLYIPLVLAGLALLASALERDKPWVHFAAGVVFGLASVTRLIVLFYFLFVPALIWLARRDRSSLRFQIAPLLLGAAVIVLPYSAFMSWKTGEMMLVENHGGFDMRNYSDHRVVGKPTLGTGLRVLVEQVTRNPAAFVGRWLEYVRMLFKPNGMRWIEWFGTFPTRPAALLGVGLRIAYDWLYLAVIALTPLGILLARRRRLAVMLVVWIVVLTAFTALSGTAGARYRSPVEPVLLAFAAVAVSCRWNARARASLALAGVVGVLLVVRLVGQVPHFGTLPAYGLRSWSPERGTGESTGHADVGLRMRNAGTGVEIVVQPTAASNETVRVEVAMDGRVLFDRTAGAGESVRILWLRDGAPYLRIRATDRTAKPVPFRFTILPRGSSRLADAEANGVQRP